MTPPDPTLDPRFIAGVALLERTGARDFRIGWSDEGDGPPVVWYACATWRRIPGRPKIGNGAEAAGALDPINAVLRLCEQVVDGGECAHCHQLTIFDPDPEPDPPLDAMGCVYRYDPELATFRRTCEGTTT